MKSDFDIFTITEKGESVLVESAQTLNDAMARVLTLREKFKGEYLVLSKSTGKKIWLRASGAFFREADKEPTPRLL